MRCSDNTRTQAETAQNAAVAQAVLAREAGVPFQPPLGKDSGIDPIAEWLSLMEVVMTPETKARQLIDQKLEQAGWVIQDMKRSSTWAQHWASPCANTPPIPARRITCCSLTAMPWA
jgi:hypothetical protein